jgi:hypothetical protein
LVSMLAIEANDEWLVGHQPKPEEVLELQAA